MSERLCVRTLSNKRTTGSLEHLALSTIGHRAQVVASIKNGGHKWCALARDNWSCHGPRYTRVLRGTKAFDAHLVRGL